MEEEIDYDGGLVVSECIEEPEEVVEELGVYQGQNPHNQDVLRSGNTKQDAENLAIGLLATRLVYDFALYLFIWLFS